MLLGEFHCITDESGDLQIPAKLRAAFDEGLTLTRGIERCLFAYPASEWRKLTDTIEQKVPLTNRDGRAFARLMFSGALTCDPGSQGQIPLPETLRRYAGIEDQATIVGLGTHLEIWNPTRWQETREQMIHETASMVEKLSHLGV